MQPKLSFTYSFLIILAILMRSTIQNPVFLHQTPSNSLFSRKNSRLFIQSMLSQDQVYQQPLINSFFIHIEEPGIPLMEINPYQIRFAFPYSFKFLSSRRRILFIWIEFHCDMVLYEIGVNKSGDNLFHNLEIWLGLLE